MIIEISVKISAPIPKDRKKAVCASESRLRPLRPRHGRGRPHSPPIVLETNVLPSSKQKQKVGFPLVKIVRNELCKMVHC